MEHANADCLQTSKRVRKIEHGCSRRSKQTKQHEDTIASGCACYQVATSDFVHHIHAGHYVSAGRQAHCCKRITNKTQMQTSIHACHTSTYKFCEIRMFADHAMLCTEGATGSPFFLRSTNARLRRARIHAYAHRCVRAYTRSQTRRARTHACAHRRVRAYTRTCTRARAHRSVRAHAASVRALLQACEQHEDALAHAHIHISTFTRSHTQMRNHT